MSNIDVEYCIKQYHSGKSAPELAKEFNTYPNKIIRLLKRSGTKLRDKAEAQKVAFETGRSVSPTKGKIRTEEEKLKISNSLASTWESQSDEYKEAFKEKKREQWEKMTVNEKAVFNDKAHKAIRKTADEGSKLEKYLLVELQTGGFEVHYHKDNLLVNQNLQVDMYIPELDAVLEIDGPSHYKPVWGTDSLQKTKKSDTDKNGLVLGNGSYMIRLKVLCKTLSGVKMRTAKSLVFGALDGIKTKKMPKLILLTLE